MKKLALVLAVGLYLTSCVKQAQSVDRVGVDGEFEVEFLFKKDGVKVYRFYDDGRYRYFTTLGETMTTQRNGKSDFAENIK